MKFRKKRHNWKELVVAGLVVISFIGVPVWLLAICLITESFWMWLVLMVWVSVSYRVAWRVENG